MRRLFLAALVIVCCSSLLLADVRTEEKAQVKFGGALGRVVNFFGGKAAKEGIVTTVAVKGDRMMRMSDAGGQLVDLAEEKIYDIDTRGKTYKVTTFADVRRQVEEDRRKAEEQQKKEGGSQPSGEQGKEMQVDVSLKDTGQTRTINSFDTHEVVMTIAVHEKGKTLEQSGGMVLTSDMWMAPKVAGMQEIADFNRRYFEKLAIPMALDAQQMAALTAMYPLVKDAIGRMQVENVKMDGTPVLTEVKVEGVQSPEQQQAAAQQKKEEEAPPTSVGGLGGKLGAKLGRRIAGGKKDTDETTASAAPGRSVVMTMTHELLKVTPAATDADVALPAGFKLRS